MPSVLIADCDHPSLEPQRELLAAASVELRVGGGDADVLIVQYATVDGGLPDRMPSCRAVVRYGVGVDTIDVEAATARGVWVVNVPDYSTDEVAGRARRSTGYRAGMASFAERIAGHTDRPVEAACAVRPPATTISVAAGAAWGRRRS